MYSSQRAVMLAKIPALQDHRLLCEASASCAREGMSERMVRARGTIRLVQERGGNQVHNRDPAVQGHREERENLLQG